MSDVTRTVKVEFIESYIKGVNGSADYQWNDNHGELVRCKDCKYLIEHDTGELECEIMPGWFPVKPDWYCANGVKRNE